MFAAERSRRAPGGIETKQPKDSLATFAEGENQAKHDSRIVSSIKQHSSASLLTNPLYLPSPALASSRYNRQMLLPQLRLRGQESLLSSKVLIIGLGGLGSPAALYIAGAGIGTLGFMDGDTVEVSNLHRQIVHSETAARFGMTKVRSAVTKCKELNSEIAYACHEEQASASNILNIVAQYDLVLDCTDNPATRYLISDACVVLRKVLISGAAQRGEGMVVMLNSPPHLSEAADKGPCYRCIFPRPPAPETVRGCSEIGILGPVVGTIGTLMAAEAIKVISRGGHLFRTAEQQADALQKDNKDHTMLLFNTYAADPRSMFRTITLRRRRKDCVACGDDESVAKKGLRKITAAMISEGRLDYQAFCGVLEDVKLLREERRVDTKDFFERHAHHRNVHQGKRRREPIVVDVREEHEFELGPQIRDSVNIPISRILRHGGDAFDALGLQPTPDPGPGTNMSWDGSLINQESHFPLASRSYPSVRDENYAAESVASGGDGGIVNEESHIPVLGGTKPGAALGSDGETVDQESHILAPINVSNRPISVFPRKPTDQGKLTAEYPEEQEDSDSEPPPVYFVCQRGNDSQIAAQKLIEKLEAEGAVAEGQSRRSARSRERGWIGDIKGGFLAMERYAAS